MKCKVILCTLTVGVIAGAVLSTASMPRRQRSHTMAGQVLKAMGSIVEEIGSAIH